MPGSVLAPIVATMVQALAIPISWTELVKRTVRESLDDDCLSLAAQLAYYFFLALFPAVLFLLAVASFFPLHNLTDDIGRTLGPFVSPEVLELIQDQMRRLANADSGGILTLGVVGAVWSSSAALGSIVGSVNKAYDLEEGRPWWKVRLVAIGLTVALAVFVLASISLILAGPSLATYLGRTVGFGPAFEWSWKILQWPVAFFLVSTAIGLVYYFGPDAEQDWVWVTPGAIVATTLWLIGSLGFKLYVATFTDYNASYGTVGGVVVLLLWFYVSGLAILVGAELNSEIDHASSYGNVEKAPARRKVIGPRAAREFQAGHPAPSGVTRPDRPPHSGPGVDEGRRDRTAGLAVASAVLATRAWNRLRRRQNTRVALEDRV